MVKLCAVPEVSDAEEQQLLSMHIKDKETKRKIKKNEKHHFMHAILNLKRKFSIILLQSTFHLDAGFTPVNVHIKTHSNVIIFFVWDLFIR